MLALPSTAMAEDISMWVRASAATGAQHLIDLWNKTHDDQIQVTVIPDTQMVPKLATGNQAGEVPDMVAFDLIYMPDFMKAGLLKDITSEMQGDPNYASVAKAYQDIATYDGKIYGTGFTPDVSILMWNKDLFKQAGLDPDKAPATIGEIHADAKKIQALGNGVYGYYFEGACQGCNIFVTSPMMVAAGAKLLPAKPGEKALQGDGVKDVLTEMHEMWAEGLIPPSAQADNGSNFVTAFEAGKIGIQGGGGLLLSDVK
jgi:multiple sugar transport system substrate-binding protein